MLISNRPGYVLSGSAHAALLVATLLSFSQTRKFDDAQESIPVEMLSNQQFNEIMKGEKTAKEIKPTPKADKVAGITETKPLPPVAEAKKDIPTPPPPLKRQPDPGEAQTQDVPTPPQKTADIVPPKPPEPEPPKPEPKPQQVKQPPAPPVAEKPPSEDAEPLIPKPPPRPDLTKAEPKKLEFKPDQLAKLLEQQKQKDQAQKLVEKSVAKPKSGDETEPMHRFDVADINRLLSKEAPQRRASTSSQLQQLASLGAPNASAAKMSPSLWGQLDALLQDQYKQCWSYIGLSGQPKYVPEIKVEYAQDGTLIGQPSLVNPPSDPSKRSLAESAMRAVRRCNPLHIPSLYQPFYEEWKGRIVRFDPDEMS
jgi:colicin import membrane protein